MLVFVAHASREAAARDVVALATRGLVPLCPQLADDSLLALGLEAEALSWAHAAVLGSPTGEAASRLGRLHALAAELELPVVVCAAQVVDQPVETAAPEQTKLFRQTLSLIYRTYLKKNRDYASANILGTGELGLVTRLWDKMARLLNLTGFQLAASFRGYRPPTAPANEAINDTYLDLATYGVIGAILRAGKWGR